jgi:type IV pilus assembly protein PilX
MNAARQRTPRMTAPKRQRGAALVVGLVLLMVLTVLGVSGMNTATLELTMASNAQFNQDAFQSAETGIDLVIARRAFNTIPGDPGNLIAPTPLGDGSYSTQAITTFEQNTPVPDMGFSMGVGTSGAVQAYHFDIVSVGTGPRNARSTHNQSFYVVGPGGT